jgi:hypothetical protein
MRTRAELVIHPVRLRVCAALVARPMNTRQIGAALPDVPPATLYRQVRLLSEHGILEVVGRRTVNGIVEPTYAVRRGAARFRKLDFAAIPPADHVRYLGILLGTQIAAAQTYFGRVGHDVIRDGTTYFGADLLLSDRESRALRGELLGLMRRYRRPIGARRRVRHVVVSLVPDPPAPAAAVGD